MKSVIVVPCYNEEARINTEAFLRALERRADLHWLFVNDGSTDKTLQILQTLKSRAEGRIHVQTLAQNSGKGEAVRHGLIRALDLGADVVGYFDADLATPLSELERMMELLADRDIFVILGSRVFLLGRRIHRKRWRFWLGRGFALLASQMLKLPVYDTQCGAKLIRVFPNLSACVAKPFLSRWLFDVELIERLLSIGGLKAQDFFEEPLYEWTDVKGSKVKIGSFFVALWDLIKIKWLSHRRTL